MIHLVQFDPNGQRLWINIGMLGIHFIVYSYRLWSADAFTPPILTNPNKEGNNDIPHDDFYPVMNDYNPSEPVAKNERRGIDVRFWVKKGDDSTGYRLKVTVKQGDVFQSAVVIGEKEVGADDLTVSLKEEFIAIKLII